MTDNVTRKVLQGAAEISRIGNAAVRSAQEESRRLGVPNVYDINGHTYYELPDGTLSLEDPWQGKNTPPDSAANDAANGAANHGD
jgi:hypothetical protein